VGLCFNDLGVICRSSASTTSSASTPSASVIVSCIGRHRAQSVARNGRGVSRTRHTAGARCCD
jgi:hypothetical protein